MKNPPGIVITHDQTYFTPALNGYQVTLSGTAAAPAWLLLDDGTANTLYSLTLSKAIGAPARGVVSLGPDHTHASLTLTNGLLVRNGQLDIGTLDGGVTLDGQSVVSDGGTFIAHSGTGVWTLNGSLTVAQGALVDFKAAPLQGHGTIHAEDGSLVYLATVLKGLHVDLDRGAMLFIRSAQITPIPTTPPHFQGLIDEAAGAIVALYGAQTATHEIFHTATGTLDLLDRANTQVASLQFAPGSREYTSGPGIGGQMDITTTAHTYDLPTIFTH